MRLADQNHEGGVASAVESGGEVAVAQGTPRTAEDYQRRVRAAKKQLQELCYAVNAETIPDLQEIFCCIVLSECVYKRPVAEMVRAVNKFKADFEGHIISLERVQPCSDHVPHRCYK